MSEASLDDVDQIKRSIDNWVIWRDSNQWERFRTLWHDDGVMVASWRQASVDDFISGSREGFDRGVRIFHQLGGSSVDVSGDRAVSMTKVTIAQRGPVHGVIFDVTCMARHYDFWERRNGRWGLLLRESVYEKDWWNPVELGATIEPDRDRLESYPDGYRHLAYLQQEAGYQVKKNMPCATGDALEELYDRGRRWLEHSSVSPLDAD